MLKKYCIKDGSIVPSEDGAGQINVFVNPDHDELKYLTTTFNLDEHTLHSALDPDEVARLEFEPDHYALIFKRPRNYSSEDQFLFKVASFGVFMFKECMIILIGEDVPLFDSRQSYKVTSLSDVLLKLLFRSIAHYLHHLRVINMISDEIEQKMNSSMDNKYLIHMFTLEKSLVYYLNALHSNALVLERLRSSASKSGLSPDHLDFLEDIVIENNQSLKQTEIYSNILSSLMNARASIVGNNLNVIMKNLNAVVIAVAIPSFFAGVGGMSEYTRFADRFGWPYSYPAFFLLMTIMGGVIFFLIKRWK